MILRAEIEDLPEIQMLQRAAFQEESKLVGDPNIKPMTQTLDEMKEEFGRGIFLKYVKGGQIIGSVRAWRIEDTCHINRLVVDPEHWREGIGVALMKAIEDEFRDVRRFELFTRIDQPTSRPFYRSLGYVPFRTERVSDSLNFVFLEKANGRDLPSTGTNC